MKVLYDSNEIHKAIKQIFKSPTERRVAVVAYVGINADKYLPNPKGIQIFCCPEPGATSPEGIRKLLKRKAIVKFSDGLHSKVYWSTSGCVITSANISDRALGCHPQQEAGVLINSNDLNIDRLIAEANPYDITNSMMDDLTRQERKIKKLLKIKKTNKNTKRQFMEWYESPYRESWKIGWWSDSELEVSQSAKKVCVANYNTNEPKEILNLSKNQASADDWLLTFETTDGKIKKIEWMYIDFISKVDSTDKGAYEEAYPFQAIQVHKLTHYPQPPFHISREFINAFKKAAKKYGVEKIENARDLTPPTKLIDLTIQNLKK
jgi:hypothetical protein